jgi:hypothetical protein
MFRPSQTSKMPSVSRFPLLALRFSGNAKRPSARDFWLDVHPLNALAMSRAAKRRRLQRLVGPLRVFQGESWWATGELIASARREAGSRPQPGY